MTVGVFKWGGCDSGGCLSGEEGSCGRVVRKEDVTFVGGWLGGEEGSYGGVVRWREGRM